MPDEGRCISCGFLAKVCARPHVEGVFGHYEVSGDERQEPSTASSMALRAGTFVSGVRTDLVCFRQRSEFGDRLATGTLEQSLRNAEFRERLATRGCAEWIKYVPDFSPKDHMTEQRIRLLEDDRKSFEKALASSGKRLTWAAIIIGVAQVVAAYLSMGPDSKWDRFWNPPARQQLNDAVQITPPHFGTTGQSQAHASRE